MKKSLRKKWYLGTWFICLVFAFSHLLFPIIIGLILLVLQAADDNKLVEKYGEIDDLNNNIDNLKATIQELESQQNTAKEYLDQLHSESQDMEKEVVSEQYNMSDYEGISSQECKTQLALLKNEEKSAINDGSLLTISGALSKKSARDNAKQIVRCFNAECDNIIQSVTIKGIDSLRNRLTKSFETLNKIYEIDGVQLNNKFLSLKLKELDLVYSFALKAEQEREQQKAIREEMVEEAKAQKEIEQQKAKLEKDQSQFNNEINRMTKYLQRTTNDAEKQLYIDKIKELEEKLKELETQKQDVLAREANAKAGYVYVISNVGSFGDNVYKIGMTRRLEPMDRIDELSSASVPFPFDVHAMIFSNDAPALEAKLHQEFDKNRVNRINSRKEFFKVNLDDIENVVKENFDNTVQFTKIPVAQEYNETLEILKRESLIA